MLPDAMFSIVVFVLWCLGVIDVQWYVPGWLAKSTDDLCNSLDIR